jgi:hypothetical protein
VETVAMSTLDALFEEVTSGLAEPRVFLKTDTQGYDLEVFRGLGRAAPWIAGLQTEVALRPIYSGMVRYLDALAELEQAGFGVTGMFPVNRDVEHLVIEFDCVMRRRGRPGPATVSSQPAARSVSATGG